MGRGSTSARRRRMGRGSKIARLRRSHRPTPVGSSTTGPRGARGASYRSACVVAEEVTSPSAHWMRIQAHPVFMRLCSLRTSKSEPAARRRELVAKGFSPGHRIIQIPIGDRALALVGVLGGLFLMPLRVTDGKGAVLEVGDSATVVESELDDLVPGLKAFATCLGPAGAEFGLGYLRTEPAVILQEALDADPVGLGPLGPLNRPLLAGGVGFWCWNAAAFGRLGFVEVVDGAHVGYCVFYGIAGRLAGAEGVGEVQGF